MKISALLQDIVPAVYDHNGEKLTLQIDRNVVNPAYLREVAKQLEAAEKASTQGKKPDKHKRSKTSQATVFEESARLIEGQIEIYISLLSSRLLKGWDLTEDDNVTIVSIPEGLRRMADEAPLLIQDIWVFAMETAQGVKKTTSPTIEDGSRESETPLDLNTPESTFSLAFSM